MMTTGPIHESGMTFGPYPDGYCYHIEQSIVYKHNQQAIKMAEFLLLKENLIWIVEAKSSSPSPENQENIKNFLEEIKQKMLNALLMFLGIWLNQHGEAMNDLSNEFRNLDFKSIRFKLVLVIKDYEKSRIESLKNVFTQSWPPAMKAFGIKSDRFFVLNGAMAKNKGLINS